LQFPEPGTAAMHWQYSALSMLTFYVNRAGRNLPATRRRTLARAKRELKVAFGREQ